MNALRQQQRIGRIQYIDDILKQAENRLRKLLTVVELLGSKLDRYFYRISFNHGFTDRIFRLLSKVENVAYRIENRISVAREVLAVLAVDIQDQLGPDLVQQV